MGMNTAKLNRKSTILANTEKMRVGLHSYENVLLKDFLEGLSRQTIAAKKFKNPYQSSEPAPLNDRERKEALDSESRCRILGLNLAKDATVVCDTGDAL